MSTAMKVRDWMTPDPVTVTLRTSVLSARRLVHLYGIRHLPVVAEGARVVGMVSDRELLTNDPLIAQALSTLQSDLLSGRYRQVEAVMASPVPTANADEPIAAAADLMLQERIAALPVLDRGRLVGILTTTDCLRALLASAREAEQDRVFAHLAGA
ncbi:MAG TPA: CBS domain-containing protein [Egibacteraceae bacterium]|nr:CBS domain-containing protein [Egibacteraceae bacterium]